MAKREGDSLVGVGAELSSAGEWSSLLPLVDTVTTLLAARVFAERCCQGCLTRRSSLDRRATRIWPTCGGEV